MKLSVIIPVYNVEETLDKCISSIVCQNLTDFEIILIDDGSPDRCPQICEEWSKKDNRIKVIHQTNKGLSGARNAGIEIANGDYLAFVDPDDYISSDLYSRLTTLLTNLNDDEVDIIEYSIITLSKNGNCQYINLNDKIYSDIRLYWFDSKAYLHSYACNKVFKRRLFQDIRFPAGIVFEDMHTLPHLLEYSRKVVTTSIGYYYYCVNNTGITAMAGKEEWRMLLNAHIKAEQMFGINKLKEEELYYMHILNIQLYTCALTGDEPILEDRMISHPLTCGSASTVAKAILLNFLGISKLCSIYKTFHIKRK